MSDRSLGRRPSVLGYSLAAWVLQTKNISSTRNVCFVLMVAKAVLHPWHNIAAVHEPEPHVLSVARNALHHHGGALVTVMVVSAADGCWAFSANCCATQSEGAVWVFGLLIRLN